MPKTSTAARPASAKKNTAKPTAAPQSGSALEIKDNRTNRTYPVPVADGAIRAVELKKIKTDDSDDTGLMSYDPAFLNTASCRSAITYIDGDKGILRYRGYPIEQLAENATFLEVAWLLRHGELPNQKEYDQWVHDITFHTYVHENIKEFMRGFRYDAHPMSMLT
ncbi:MAG: citrate/2-methylcitrate synthase, partial [Gemmatimonadaceae bacterium]